MFAGIGLKRLDGVSLISESELYSSVISRIPPRLRHFIGAFVPASRDGTFHQTLIAMGIFVDRVNEQSVTKIIGSTGGLLMMCFPPAETCLKTHGRSCMVSSFFM